MSLTAYKIVISRNCGMEAAVAEWSDYPPSDDDKSKLNNFTRRFTMAKEQKPAATTKVAAKPTQKKKEKSKGRPVFGLVGNKDEKIYPFKAAVPEGYNFKEFKPLKKKDFVDDATYLEYRAAECEAKAVAFKAQAEEARKIGSSKDKQKAKRLIKLQEKMDELKKQLQDQGIDVESLLKTEEEKVA